MRNSKFLRNINITVDLFLVFAIILVIRVSAQTPCVPVAQGDMDCNGAVELVDYEVWRKESISREVYPASIETWRQTYVVAPDQSTTESPSCPVASHINTCPMPAEDPFHVPITTWQNAPPRRR